MRVRCEGGRCGRCGRRGMRIEMVLYESLPGVWVTGNVYRPEGVGGMRGC
jgi:hypothetical protein